MNQKIGRYASAVNLLSVIGFALSMLAGSPYGSYLSSIFIAFSFVAMMCAFAADALASAKAAGNGAMAFGAMYALCNAVVYYIQLTTVRSQPLADPIDSLLNYNHFGLVFNLDMLGYCLMAVATFFAGLTIRSRARADRWLKGLLMVHGIFSISCFILPMLQLFHDDMQGGEWIGTAVLLFWCVYFTPVSLLSIRYFAHPHSPDGSES